MAYGQDLAVLGDEIDNVVREGELAGPGGERHQVIVVDKVVAAEGNQHESVAHEPLCLVFSDE